MSTKFFVPRSKIVSTVQLTTDYLNLWQTLRTDLLYNLISNDITSGNLSVDYRVYRWFGLKWTKTRHGLESLLEAWYTSGTKYNDCTCVSERLSKICGESKNTQWMRMAHFISGYRRKYLHNDTGKLYALMQAWLSVTETDEMELNDEQLKTFEIMYNGLPTAIDAAKDYIEENHPLKTYQDLVNDYQLIQRCENGETTK